MCFPPPLSVLAQLDRGGVRVDAKASGVDVSPAKVEDNSNGTYTINLTVGLPGEVKVLVRVDGTDLPSYMLVVQAAGQKGAKEEEAAPVTAQPAAPKAGSNPEATPPPMKPKRQETAAVIEQPAEKAGEAPQPQAEGAEDAKPTPSKAKEAVALLSSETLFAEADELDARAVAAAAKADDPKSLGVSVGAALEGRFVERKSTDRPGFYDLLIKEWDPNRDGFVSKMEFRTNVRASVAHIHT